MSSPSRHAEAALGAPNACARPSLGQATTGAWRALAVVLGLFSMYAPTYLDLALGPWQANQMAHGPLIALIAAYLFWQHRGRVLQEFAAPSNGMGMALLGSGLLVYIVGRSQQIPLLDVGSQIPVFAGVVLLMRGRRALRALWFPLLFLAFMIPLPGILVDMLTGALKEWVSIVVEEILYRAGLPVARSGVVLTLGQYQLLVADACSGLHSMFTLLALGMLFVHLMDRASVLHNGLMIAALVPIAFAANVVRVLALALVTYYLGDEAGRGFVHDLSGLLLFVAALSLLFGIDALLIRTRTRVPPAANATA